MVECWLLFYIFHEITLEGMSDSAQKSALWIDDGLILFYFIKIVMNLNMLDTKSISDQPFIEILIFFNLWILLLIILHVIILFVGTCWEYRYWIVNLRSSLCDL